MKEKKEYNGIEYYVSTDIPPVYQEAKKKFPKISFDKGIVFTYGDCVYVKSGELRDDVEAHETVHVMQQGTYPGGPEEWWNRYLKDEDFRLSQELAAYKVQYKFVTRNYKKGNHFEMLKFYAESLVKFYELDLSVMQAINLIKK